MRALCDCIAQTRAIDDDLAVDLRFCKGCGICANECPEKSHRHGAGREVTLHSPVIFIKRYCKRFCFGGGLPDDRHCPIPVNLFVFDDEIQFATFFTKCQYIHFPVQASMNGRYFGDTRDLFKFDLVRHIMKSLPDLAGFIFVPMLTGTEAEGYQKNSARKRSGKGVSLGKSRQPEPGTPGTPDKAAGDRRRP